MPAIPICPACDAKTYRVVEIVSEYKILECENCRLSFSDPMRSGSEAYYDKHIVYRNPNAATARSHLVSVDHRENRSLLHSLNRGSRMLDIGCGYGAFVALAVRNGHDAFGVDFNSAEIEIGTQVYDLEGRLHAGRIEDVSDHIERKYDVVTAFEVIEHVENPRALLQLIYDILIPGGKIILSCPNEDRWQPLGRIFVDYPPHHLTRWRPETLVQVLRAIGFVDIGKKLNASARDILWTYYVNQSAARRLAGNSTHDRVADDNSTGRNWKHSLFDVAGFLSKPMDMCLRALNVGTMGMRVFATKPK